MFWKILGTLGASSFFVTGLSVLGNPDCISADIGGGRVIGVTCRSDSFGAFTGGTAGTLMILIGIVILTLIYWSNIKVMIKDSSGTRFNSDFGNSVQDRNDHQTSKSLKTCTICNTDVPLLKSFCLNCSGSSFTFFRKEPKSIQVSSEEAMYLSFPPSNETLSEKIPDLKECPMCAEQIKFAAKKCRYCGSMIIEDI